jgi:hypothetical protein
MKEQRIKEKIKGRYEKIAFVGNSSEGCCAPAECCGGGGVDSTGNALHGRRSTQLRKKN